MPRLQKNTLALTFKFDCDRYLRFRLASDDERKTHGFDAEAFKRPGIELIQAAGRRWETDKYQDLVDAAGPGRVVYQLDAEVNELIGRRPFAPVPNLFDLLRQPTPPRAVIEAEFVVPADMLPGLREIYDRYHLEEVRAIPDILWLRRGPTGAPLIGHAGAPPEYEIHIIDVKMAAEPSLRHFTEVTFYALGLARALEVHGLADRYAVSAEGYIWPGSHDANAFRNLVRDHTSRAAADALTQALLDTLQPVPYEVYQVHVRQFFEERLRRVLGELPLEAAWHVAPKCQLCDYIRYCTSRAHDADHLSRVPWLTHGQAELLRAHGLETTNQLATAIGAASPPWLAAQGDSHQFRADGPALLARSRALHSGHPEVVEGRRCALIPAWSDMNIFLTVHFDPGSGISFALGASLVYFPPGRAKGSPPVTEGEVFVIDRVNNLNPESERARLLEFAKLVTGWLDRAHRDNEAVRAARRAASERDRDFGKASVHFFFWDRLEVTQLRRMFARHMAHPDVTELVELLVRLFPPDDLLPDPDYFQSQPGTVAKEVIKLLIGLPLAHDYTLLEAANVFYPNPKSGGGGTYEYRLPYGFVTEMSDQIPFERAYELWEDRIFLRHPEDGVPPARWRRYFRHEIVDGIKRAVRTRLDALQHIVRKLRQHHGGLLTLRKSPFSTAPPTQTQVPEPARNLIAFEKLNVACAALENRQQRSLPVEEREARFLSIRGLLRAAGGDYERMIATLRAAEPRYAARDLLAFTFAPTSRDARIKARDFLLAISTEEDGLDLDVPWRTHAGLTFDDAMDALRRAGLPDAGLANALLAQLLQVEVAALEPTHEPPFLVLAPARTDAFRFAQTQGLLDLSRCCVLDPLHRDFTSQKVELVLRTVGGDPPPLKRKRR
jgi:hypothetical protein